MSHDSLHCNFTRAIVINNKLFFRGPGDKRVLDFTYLELDENSQNPISSMEALNHYVRRLRPRIANNGSARTFNEEFIALKRPGKKLRLSLTKKQKMSLICLRLNLSSNFWK
jgi:hypothetical protein